MRSCSSTRLRAPWRSSDPRAHRPGRAVRRGVPRCGALRTGIGAQPPTAPLPCSRNRPGDARGGPRPACCDRDRRVGPGADRLDGPVRRAGRGRRSPQRYDTVGTRPADDQRRRRHHQQRRHARLRRRRGGGQGLVRRRRRGIPDTVGGQAGGVDCGSVSRNHGRRSGWGTTRSNSETSSTTRLLEPRASVAVEPGRLDRWWPPVATRSRPSATSRQP